MIVIKKYLPQYVEVDGELRAETLTVNNIKELLELEWIKQFQVPPYEDGIICRDFHGAVIWIENSDGTFWWPIATVDEGDVSDLPVLRQN